jgi:hypothetical protein
MKDNCMICLDECNIYLKLQYCNCKNICHEKCFKNYIKNNNKIKCLICKKVIDFEYIIRYISSNPFFNTFIYGLFIVLQNIYFYIDDKFFPTHLTFFRTTSALVVHILLTIILVMPYMILLYINYTITMCRKSYKVCTL